ncbi:hypothetical protein ASF58_05230 [Methylobacterium sp. Leaf125]|nr:hypothetical protein ASF58_05230 [Methylobacterium sp. Leaf125]
MWKGKLFRVNDIESERDQNLFQFGLVGDVGDAIDAHTGFGEPDRSGLALQGSTLSQGVPDPAHGGKKRLVGEFLFEEGRSGDRQIPEADLVRWRHEPFGLQAQRGRKNAHIPAKMVVDRMVGVAEQRLIDVVRLRREPRSREAADEKMAVVRDQGPEINVLGLFDIEAPTAQVACRALADQLQFWAAPVGCLKYEIAIRRINTPRRIAGEKDISREGRIYTIDVV